MFGVYGKKSILNFTGKAGVSDENFSTSFKSVIDIGSRTAQAGLQYKSGFGLAGAAKYSVLTARLTAELQIYGREIEVGVTGNVISLGGELMYGLFPNGGLNFKIDAAAGIGGGYLFRIKPAQ